MPSSIDISKVDLKNCYFTHAFGGTSLPNDGYLLPRSSPFGEVNEEGQGKTIALGNTCVYLTFNAIVPSEEMSRFLSGPVILIPYSNISNQLISVGFAECAALGPVLIGEGSIIIYPGEIPSSLPEYYKKIKCEIRKTENLMRRNELAKALIYEKSKMLIEMKNSKNQHFPVNATVTYFPQDNNKVTEEIAPKDFFAPWLTDKPELALGIDSCSYRGAKHWMACISQLNVNQPYARNSFLHFFILNFSIKQASLWLNKFQSLPKNSLAYFEKKTNFMYNTWTELSVVDSKLSQEKKEQLIQNENMYKPVTETQIDFIFKQYLSRKEFLDMPKDVIFYDFIRLFIPVMSNTFGTNIEKFTEEYASFLTSFLPENQQSSVYTKEKLFSILKFVYAQINFNPDANTHLFSELDAGYAIDKTASKLLEQWKKPLNYRLINPLSLPYSIQCMLYYLDNVTKVSMEEYFTSETSSVNKTQNSTAFTSFASIKTLKNVPEMIEFICRTCPTLEKTFNSSAQVSQEYTIRTHTLMFYNALTDHLSLPEARSRFSTIERTCPNIKHIFYLAVTLHDLGKANGNKEEHHENTWTLVEPFLKQWGYAENEISFIESLINHDIIGDFAKNTASDENLSSEQLEKQTAEAITAATQALHNNYKKIGNLIEKDQYFYLQFLFYLSDAGSYPSLYCTLMRPLSDHSLGFKHALYDNQPFSQLLTNLVPKLQRLPSLLPEPILTRQYNNFLRRRRTPVLEIVETDELLKPIDHSLGSSRLTRAHIP